MSSPISSGPSINYVRTQGEGVKPSIHFYCVLHAKRGEGVQIACKIAYVINGRPVLNYRLLHCFIESQMKLDMANLALRSNGKDLESPQSIRRTSQFADINGCSCMTREWVYFSSNDIQF